MARGTSGELALGLRANHLCLRRSTTLGNWAGDVVFPGKAFGRTIYTRSGGFFWPLAALLARYRSPRICASFAPCQRPKSPRQTWYIYFFPTPNHRPQLASFPPSSSCDEDMKIRNARWKLLSCNRRQAPPHLLGQRQQVDLAMQARQASIVQDNLIGGNVIGIPLAGMFPLGQAQNVLPPGLGGAPLAR